MKTVMFTAIALSVAIFGVAHTSPAQSAKKLFFEGDLVRHTLVMPEEIALVEDGAIAGHVGATVTRVWGPPKATRESKADEIIHGRGEILAQADHRRLA